MRAKLDPNTTHRTCKQCATTKLLAAFPRCASKALGRQYTCRECRKKYDRARRPATGRPRGPTPQTMPPTPLPAMDLLQRLECRRLARWRYPIEQTGQLVGWSI